MDIAISVPTLRQLHIFICGKRGTDSESDLWMKERGISNIYILGTCKFQATVAVKLVNGKKATTENSTASSEGKLEMGTV